MDTIDLLDQTLQKSPNKVFNKNVELSDALFQLRNCQKYIPSFEDCLKNQTTLLEQIAKQSLRLHDWVSTVEGHSVKLANLQERVKYYIDDKPMLELTPELQNLLQVREQTFDQKLVDLEERVPSFQGLQNILKHQVDLVMINDYYRNRLGLLEKAMNSHSEFSDSAIGQKLKIMEENNLNLLQRSEIIKKDIIQKVQVIEEKVQISHDAINEITGGQLNTNMIKRKSTNKFDFLGTDLENGGFGFGGPSLKKLEQDLINPKFNQLKTEQVELTQKMIHLDALIQDLKQKDQASKNSIDNLRTQLNQQQQLSVSTFQEVLEYKMRELSTQSESQKKDLLDKMQHLQQIIFNRFQNNSISSFDSPLNSTSIDSTTEKLSVLKINNMGGSLKHQGDIQDILSKLQNYVELTKFNQLDLSQKQSQQVINAIQQDILHIKESIVSNTNNIKKENESHSRENKRLLAQSREIAVELQNFRDRGRSQDANILTPINQGNQKKSQNLSGFNNQAKQNTINQALPELNINNKNETSSSFFQMNPQAQNSHRSRVLKPIGSVHSRNQTIRNVSQFVNQSLDLLPEVIEKSQIIETNDELFKNQEYANYDRNQNQDNEKYKKSHMDDSSGQISIKHSQLKNKFPENSINNSHREPVSKNQSELKNQMKIFENQEFDVQSKKQLYINTPTVVTRNKNLGEVARNKSQDGASSQLVSRANAVQLKKFSHIFEQMSRDNKKSKDQTIFRNSYY
eukprot:403376459